MGKLKRHCEDKHNLKQKNKNITMVPICKNNNVELKIELKIMVKDLEHVKKYWNTSDIKKQIVIKKLNNIDNKNENTKWALEHIIDLFDFACEKQQIEFVLFVVLNFSDKYYAKIKAGKIIDWCSINNSEKFHIRSLHEKSFSSWWLKGFNICSHSTECVICFENTSDNIKTKCNHIFCRDCIGQHLQIQTDCPYCRTSLLCDRRGKSYDNCLPLMYCHSLFDNRVGIVTASDIGQRLTQLNLSAFHYAGLAT